MKKLFVTLATLVLCMLLCVSAFAAEKTVYIASGGNDANDGATYQTAVKTVDKAYELIGKNDGKIIVCSYVNVGGGYVLPKHDGTVTFTSGDGKNYFPLGRVAFSQSLTLSGDTVFERTGLSGSGAVFISAAGNNLTIGKKVVTSGDIGIIGGHNSVEGNTVAEVSISNDYTISVASGDFMYIRGGNRRATGKSPFGMISGNVTVNITGGTFKARDNSNNLTAATGMCEHSGNVTMNISGGCFYGSVFAVCRAGSNSTAQQPKVSGNITINITGGAINGKRLDENQDDSIAFTGKYTLNLSGASFSSIESIAGSATSTLNISSDLEKGTGTTVSEFQNPLRGGADPWVIYRDGYYYMTTVSGVTVYCYKSPTLDGLAYVSPTPIWTAPQGGEINATNKMYSADIWSPELHYIEANEFGEDMAGWWLYFAADDGENTNHRLYCVRALTDDACGQYGSPVTRKVNEPVKTVVYGDKEWAIGQSLLRANGKTYMTWTGEKARGTADHHQTLNIAELVNPYTIKGEGSVICVPDYKWETRGYAYNANTGASYPKVVEGATAVYGDNGEIMIIYSASGYWTNYYCLATLTLTPGANPLVKSSWAKSEEPVFQRQNDVYGPGHAAFTTDAAGNRWMIYHAYLDWKRTNRHVFIQPWTLTGTTVDMNGGPYSQSTVFSIVNNNVSIANVIKGFGR